MTGFFSPDMVRVLGAVVLLAIGLGLAAAVIAVRDTRRDKAHRALAETRVPGLDAVMRGEPYRGLKDRLDAAVRQADHD